MFIWTGYFVTPHFVYDLSIPVRLEGKVSLQAVGYISALIDLHCRYGTGSEDLTGDPTRSLSVCALT